MVSWTEEEEQLEFGALLQRIGKNDPGLNHVCSHETAEDTVNCTMGPSSVKFEARPIELEPCDLPV